MKANAFPLKYQCKTSSKEIQVRKLADQRYQIFKGENQKPESVSAYSLRKTYKFISDSQPKNSLRVKRTL